MLWVGLDACRHRKDSLPRVGESERRVLTDIGLTASEVDDVAWTLELLGKSSNGALPRQKLLALLEASGAPQSEGDFREAERLYYRGQAAALLAVDAVGPGFPRCDRLVENVLARSERTHPAPECSHGALREPVITEVRHVEATDIGQIAVVPAPASLPTPKACCKAATRPLPLKRRPPSLTIKIQLAVR